MAIPTLKDKITGALATFWNYLSQIVVKYDDVVNNCTTNTDRAKSVPLSAYQGYRLQNQITSNLPYANTLTATTGASGYISTSLRISDIMVLQAWDGGTTNSHIVIPFVANGVYWYFKVLNNGSMQSVANTSVTIKYLSIATNTA